MKIRIQTNSLNPDGCVTNAETGEVLHVVSGSLALSRNCLPVAHLQVFAHELDVETDQVKWWGLDDVPTEALQAELTRRGEQAGAQA